MNDDELRALVRAAIAQHTAGRPLSVGDGPGATADNRPLTTGTVLHPSHGRFAGLPPGSHVEGPCLIEPTVPCNHCGYCQSFGH
jgi:hypothetical protein